MEDTLQKVFGILLAVIVFFLLPLYMAFEKKDDISYSMALRITSNFVDNIANKGYISKEMYLDYVSDLALTDNAYEITFQHTAKKYYPVIYGNKADGTKVKYDYNGFINNNTYKTQYDEYLKGNDANIDGVTYKNDSDPTSNTLLLNYSLEQIQHTDKEILGYLEGDIINQNDIEYVLENGTKVYPMSKGDEFTVVIKNTNTTIASILFNTLTMGINQGENTKIYINYGGTVQNESYRKNMLTGESTDVNDTRTETEQSVTFGDPKNGIVMGKDHPVDIVYGDINSDGYIKIQDSSLLLKHIENNEAIDKQIADLNFNGYIDRNDLYIIDYNLSGNLDKILCTDKTIVSFYVKYDTQISETDLNNNLVVDANNTVTKIENAGVIDGYYTYKVTVKAGSGANYVKLGTKEIVLNGVTYGARERVVKIIEYEPLKVEIDTNEPNPTKNNKIKYIIDFGREVIDFDQSDINYGGSHILDFNNLGGGRYTVTIGSTGSGTQNIRINSGVCKDKYGNSNMQSEIFTMNIVP